MKKNHFFKHVMVLFLSFGTLFGSAQTLKFEAEDATLNGLGPKTDQGGYSGTSFVGEYGNAGKYAEFTVSGVDAGRHDIIIRYATDDNNIPIDLYVNNVKIEELSLPRTGCWGCWSDFVVYANLTANENIIKLMQRSDGGHMNLDFISVTVEVPIAVTGVEVSPTTADVIVNATKQLTATITPETAANKTVSWSSSNTAVAEVNSSGMVLANAVGSAVITATTVDGKFISTCEITVVPDPNANFEITYTEGNGNHPAVSNNDLLQTAQINRIFTGASFFNKIHTLTDGSNTDQDVIFDNASMTYSLDVSTNTSGYDITGFDIFTQWVDNGCIEPNVAISYSLVGSPDDFISLTTAKFSATVGNSGGYPWTRSNIYNGGAIIRSGVAKLKFVLGPQKNGYTGYSEIDVFGFATSPGTGINDIEKNASIYGANNNIVVDLSSQEGSSLITVIDTRGSVVKSIQSKGSGLLNINIPTNGIYMVLVQNGDKLSSQKVVLN